MNMILTDNSVCELMYIMRDAVQEGKLSVAVFLSREIHDKLLILIANKESIQCTLDCCIDEDS